MHRILIADDEKTILLLYAEELSEEGYEVLTCSDGSGLMDLIGIEGPDLLVLDIRLGRINGLDLLQEIKKRYTGLPVILCSAYEYFKKDIRSMAADDFVVKRLSLDELKKKIKKILFKDIYADENPKMGVPSQDLPRYQQEAFEWDKS